MSENAERLDRAGTRDREDLAAYRSCFVPVAIWHRLYTLRFIA